MASREDAESPFTDDLPEADAEAETFTWYPLVLVDGDDRLTAPRTTGGLSESAEVLRALAKTWKEAYVIDLAGLAKNDPRLDLLALAGRRSRIWMDAGSPRATDAMDILVSGASRITLRYSTLEGWDELEEFAQDAEQVYLGIEFREGRAVPHPRDGAMPVQLLASRAREAGAGIIAIDLDPSPRHVRDIARALAVGEGETWYVGPGLDAHDARVLEDAGFTGAIVPDPPEPPAEETASPEDEAEEDAQ